jgi:hypothetical protein
MSTDKTIRGTKVNGDVVDLATDDSGLITAIVGFFDVAFPRGKDVEPDSLGERARSRANDRATTPPPLLR